MKAIPTRQINIMTLIGGIILIAFCVVAVNITYISSRTSRKVEEEEIKINLNTNKQLIQELIYHSLDELKAIRELALVFASSEAEPRSKINEVLKAHTRSNSDLLGFWIIWERDQLGADADYIGQEGSNEFGNYVPYWHWSGDSIVLEVSSGYDTAAFWLLPKKALQPLLLDPFYYPVNGEETLLVSLVLPIIKSGKFMGVVGADISLEKIQQIVKQIGELERGEISLLSANGRFVVHSNEAKIGTFVPHIRQDTSQIASFYIEEIQSTGILEESVRFITQIEFGNLSKQWFLTLKVPEGVITEDFNTIRFNILMVTGISALLILFLVIYNEIRWRRDQHEKLHYQQELSKSDARLTSFIESPDTFSIYSLDRNLTYTGFNSLHKKEMKENFNAEVAVGKNILKLIPSEMVENARNQFRRALNGEQFSVTSIFNGEYFSQIFNPVYDQNSQVIGLTSSVFNVTDRIIAEQEIEKYKDHLEELVAERTQELTIQKEFSQKIVDQIPAMIFVRSREGQYRLVNQRMADSVGKEIRELIGKSVFDSHPDPEESKRFLEEDKLILETGQVIKQEIAYTWPDGSRKWLFFTKTRMMVGDTGFILGVHFDITDLKEAELKLNLANSELQEALEKLKNAQVRLVENDKMASLGQLTAGLAHEINNPINYVAGNIQPIKRDLKEIVQLMDAIMQEPSEEKQHKHLQDLEMVFEEVENLLSGIADGAERVITLMDNLKSFAVPIYEAKGEVNLNYCLTTTINLIQYQAGRRIQFTSDLSDLPRIHGNVDQLKQVFLNLMTNAIHAIPESGKIEAKSFVEADQIVIHITDTGSGIPHKILGKIFDPFFTTKDVGQGTGLGLSISYRIISEHGGQIRVKETSQKGTTFEITFPISSTEIHDHS